MTEFQQKVLDLILDKPGEDPAWLAESIGTSPAAFGRAASTLEKKDLVFRESSMKNHGPRYVWRARSV